MITPEEKFAEVLFNRYPKTRGTLTIKFPVFTRRSGSSVWQIEISEQNSHPGGAAYATYSIRGIGDMIVVDYRKRET